MNMPVPGADGPEIVTQESLLLGAAERIARIRDGRVAVHLHLSRLKPQNRQDGQIRIAYRMLEPMVNAYRGQIFLLGTSDIVFLLKDPNATDVENMVYKLRALFSKDPLTFRDEGDGRDNFCSWYELSDSGDYEAFLAVAREATDEARKRTRGKVAARPELPPLDSKGLDDLLTRLAKMNVTGLIRRQSSMIVGKDAKALVYFQEFFVAMAELQKALAPNVNLLGNRWLFQHLSQTLDLKVLGALGEMTLRAKPKIYSLNLNITTIGSKAFEAFEAGIAGQAEISVELQVLDILADSRGFFAARQRLRDKGHMVVVDGLNELTMQFMDISQFDADLYKVTWSPDMMEGEHGAAMAEAIATIDTDKILLARCDSEAAIGWGLNRGIARFQGRYVDSMLSAYTMQSCDKAGACTLAQCTGRHAVISGPLRDECGNNDMLDSSPVMMAPRARGQQGGAS
ncbi:hypothetical protein [Telmatospirillum siberiense]|uniref:EAL domain-containing protein n=1 Tax=Telmatospirillum siberiense TaxID=382514 RepID=A0A2N3PQS8_9PROT|nr:hypothetical protein [Telmatospirillum siberiense]PKU22763.1 hypothetical protein CWS72_20015 [Telmatospirillum siberiense]